MTGFQIVLLAILACLATITAAAGMRGWVTLRAGLLGMLLWIAAAVAVLWPELTTQAAKVVGIRRGADLLLYCTVIAMIVGFLMVYVRLRRLRREMTLLVRELALRQAEP